MRRRRVVAYEAVESPETWVFNAAATGDMNRPRHIGRGRFWCAADKPEHQHVKPVYGGTKVPADAACCECHIDIHELQELMR